MCGSLRVVAAESCATCRLWESSRGKEFALRRRSLGACSGSHNHLDEIETEPTAKCLWDDGNRLQQGVGC